MIVIKVTSPTTSERRMLTSLLLEVSTNLWAGSLPRRHRDHLLARLDADRSVSVWYDPKAPFGVRLKGCESRSETGLIVRSSV